MTLSDLNPASLINTSRTARRMTIDLSLLPPTNLPTPASNTLIITNIENTLIFRNENLSNIKALISKVAPVHSWAPFKSFRRIIVSFFDIDAATEIRQLINDKAIFGKSCKVYFGQPTPIEAKNSHLNLPDSGKLFFISPPPSPPHGWEMRLEDAPNKQVVAEDLAEALKRLHTKSRGQYPDSPISDNGETNSRIRSVSFTTIYKPEEHGGSSNLPAINVEDTTGEDTPLGSYPHERPIFAHTCRPPVELIDSNRS